MVLTRVSDNPWAEGHTIPTYYPPPVHEVPHFPLTAERAEAVVRSHIERQGTGPDGRSRSTTTEEERPSISVQIPQQDDEAQRPGAACTPQGMAASPGPNTAGNQYPSPSRAHWGPDDDEHFAFASPTGAMDASAPGTLNRQRTRRVSCPSVALSAELLGPNSDALEPLANHNKWQFGRTPGWKEGVIYCPGTYLDMLATSRRYPRGQASPHSLALQLFGEFDNAHNSFAPGLRRRPRLDDPSLSHDQRVSLAAVIIQSYCRGWRDRRYAARLREQQRLAAGVGDAAAAARAAAEELARQRGEVRRQLRQSARDCLLAIQAQRDYEFTRNRIMAARGMVGSGSAPAPPPPLPRIQPRLWQQAVALGMDPVQLLLDSGLMSKQIQDIIAASDLAQALPNRMATMARKLGVSTEELDSIVAHERPDDNEDDDAFDAGDSGGGSGGLPQPLGVRSAGASPTAAGAARHSGGRRESGRSPLQAEYSAPVMSPPAHVVHTAGIGGIVSASGAAPPPRYPHPPSGQQPHDMLQRRPGGAAAAAGHRPMSANSALPGVPNAATAVAALMAAAASHGPRSSSSATAASGARRAAGCLPMAGGFNPNRGASTHAAMAHRSSHSGQMGGVGRSSPSRSSRPPSFLAVCGSGAPVGMSLPPARTLSGTGANAPFRRMSDVGGIPNVPPPAAAPYQQQQPHPQQQQPQAGGSRPVPNYAMPLLRRRSQSQCLYNDTAAAAAAVAAMTTAARISGTGVATDEPLPSLPIMPCDLQRKTSLTGSQQQPLAPMPAAVTAVANSSPGPRRNSYAGTPLQPTLGSRGGSPAVSPGAHPPLPALPMHMHLHAESSSGSAGRRVSGAGDGTGAGSAFGSPAVQRQQQQPISSIPGSNANSPRTVSQTQLHLPPALPPLPNGGGGNAGPVRRPSGDTGSGGSSGHVSPSNSFTMQHADHSGSGGTLKVRRGSLLAPSMTGPNLSRRALQCGSDAVPAATPA